MRHRSMTYWSGALALLHKSVGKSERRRHNVGITKRPLLLNTSFFSYDAYVGEMKTKLAYEEEWCSVSARSR